MSCSDNDLGRTVLRNAAAGLEVARRTWREAFHTCIKLGQLDVVRRMLQVGRIQDELAEPTASNEELKPLKYAACGGQVTVMAFLLTDSPEIRARMCSPPGLRDVSSALNYATHYGHADVVALLINQARANPNAPIGGLHWPLQVAASHGHTETMKVLLDAGAHRNLRGLRNYTVLAAAAESGCVAAVDLALRNCPHSPDERDADGCTPLLLAAKKGHHAVVGFLLDSGCLYAAARDRDGTTPLMAASRARQAGMVERLLASGRAEPAARDGRGQSALMVLLAGLADFESHCLLFQPAYAAEAKGQAMAIVALLRAAVADTELELPDVKGDTALELAVRTGVPAIVRALFGTGPVGDAMFAAFCMGRSRSRAAGGEETWLGPGRRLEEVRAGQFDGPGEAARPSRADGL